MALTGGASGDEVDLTVTLTDSDTSGRGHVTDKTKVFNIVVDANSTATFACSLPAKLNGADRYMTVSVAAAAGTGAPTVSSVTAGAVYRVHPEGVPVQDDDFGTGINGYDKDGYINSTAS
jgi:hypothetical protein